MRHFVLFIAIFKKYLVYLQRYFFNTLSGMVSIFMIFLIVFYGAKALGAGGPQFGSTLDGIVVGFIVWAFAIFAYSELSWDLITEAQQGTLEQLYMSPLGFRSVVLSQLVVAFIYQLIVLGVLLLLMMASSGKWLHIDLISLLPLLLLSVMGVYGIGFVMGGLALVFKQIQSAFQILQFVFIVLIAAPIDTFPFVKYLPLSWGTQLIGRVMIGGESIGQMPLGDLLFLLINATFYFLGGLLIFKLLENAARDRGLLGHY